jgi:hypothetical protein
MTATQLRGNFPGHTPKAETVKKPAKKKAAPASTNFAAIKRTRAPYKPPKYTGPSKWADLFQGAKEGDCWEMQPEDCPRAEIALRKWLEKNEIKGIIRRNAKCDDGKGRVWLLKVLK